MALQDGIADSLGIREHTKLASRQKLWLGSDKLYSTKDDSDASKGPRQAQFLFGSHHFFVHAPLPRWGFHDPCVLYWKVLKVSFEAQPET